MIRLATLSLLLAASPSAAAVYEIDGEGSVERLDTPPPVRAIGEKPGRPRSTASALALALRPDVERAGRQYEVSPALIDAIAHVESRYDARAVSRAGAAGVMQLMPGTARALGVDRRDAAANIRGGSAYLRQLLNRFDGDIVRTVAAYNAGPGAVQRAGGVPRYPETVAYVASVMDHLAGAAQ